MCMCAVVADSTTTPQTSNQINNPELDFIEHKTFFFIVIQLQLYAFSPPPSPPPHVNPPPSPLSTLPLGFVHVSFVVVPEKPSPHYTFPTPLWLLLDCS